MAGRGAGRQPRSRARRRGSPHEKNEAGIEKREQGEAPEKDMSKNEGGKAGLERKAARRLRNRRSGYRKSEREIKMTVSWRPRYRRRAQKWLWKIVHRTTDPFIR